MIKGNFGLKNSFITFPNNKTMKTTKNIIDLFKVKYIPLIPNAKYLLLFDKTDNKISLDKMALIKYDEENLFINTTKDKTTIKRFKP